MSLHPTPQQIATLQAAKIETPIVMLNLLKFRATAKYPANLPHKPCSGPEAYQRYSAAVFPFLVGVGGKMLQAGKVEATIIGPTGKFFLHLSNFSSLLY